MHVILMTRGINHEVELWKKFMETQMWYWTRQPLLKGPDGKYITDGENEDGTTKYKRGPSQVTRVQGALRPIQLWEYVIPRRGAMMVGGKLVETDNLKELQGAMNIHQAVLRPEVATPAWFLRKAWGAKKMPVFPELKGKKPEEITTRYIKHDAVATYPIGIRDDPVKDFIFNPGTPQEEGWYQEGL